MLAVALQWAEVETRLDKPPRGPHRGVAHLARVAFDHQQEKVGGQLSIRKFAALTGKSYTAVNNWLDGATRIRSDSAEILRRLGPPDARRTNGSEVNAVPLDPANGRSYDSPAGDTRGAAVPSAEGLYIAALLDRIEDDGVRGKAMDAAREAIERFLHSGAGKRTGPSPGKS